MAKYITRTIEKYATKVTFVMNKQISDYVLEGVVGKKEAKKQIESVYDRKDVTIVSCEKISESSKLYRMLESDFIKYAEEVIGKDN